MLALRMKSGRIFKLFKKNPKNSLTHSSLSRHKSKAPFANSFMNGFDSHKQEDYLRELWRSFEAGNQSAIKELYAYYSPKLEATALKYTGDIEKAKELVQEILLDFMLSPVKRGGDISKPLMKKTIERSRMYAKVKK